jgi:DNA-binding NarL/FixJ family response regulator
MSRDPSPGLTPQPGGEVRRISIPRRELVVLRAYVAHGSHKAAAHSLGIAESTSRQRMSSLLRRLGVRTTAQAVFALRRPLERELGGRDASG